MGTRTIYENVLINSALDAYSVKGFLFFVFVYKQDIVYVLVKMLSACRVKQGLNARKNFVSILAERAMMSQP